MEASQELDQISGGVPTFLGIPRSANNPGSKAKSERSDQSILKGSVIFKSKYTYYFLETNDSVWIDLAGFSISTLFNSSILERPQDIVCIIFQTTFSFGSINGIFFLLPFIPCSSTWYTAKQNRTVVCLKYLRHYN